MSKEYNYVSVAELAEADDPSLVWRVPLPDYAPTEQIMVNVHRLGRLAHLGGMESLRIDGYVGDITQVTPEVDAVDDQGTATATVKGSISKPETFKTSLSRFDDAELPYDYEWTSGKVSLNIAELDERVARRTKLRDPKEWSRQIDKALRGGVRTNSWESLVSKAPSDYKWSGVPFLTGVGLGTVLRSATKGQLGVGDAGSAAMLLSSYGLVLRHLSFKLFRMGEFRGRFSDKKHTLIPGPPLDRYLVLNLLSRTQPVVKPKGTTTG
jgi:hypothetical protein